MSGPEVVVVRHDPCAWLPAGGVAEVVVSARPAPAPVAVVRLLVTVGPDLWVVPRDDGRGLDLPSLVVASDQAADVSELRDRGPGGTSDPRPLGFVRNTVPATVAGYPWPAPVAHFAVWHCSAPRRSGTGGQWLGQDEATAVLDRRHWWPLRPLPSGGGGRP